MQNEESGADQKTNEAGKPESPAVQAMPSETQDALEVENLIESYQILGEWIRFADAKAAAVLTINGVLAGLLVPPIHGYVESTEAHPTAWWVVFVIVVFVAWLFTMIGSCVLAFACILPFRRRGKHPAIGHADHFHAAAISVAYGIDDTKRFVQDFERLGMSGLKKEIAVCMLVDSHISNHKYARVTSAIRMLALSAILGLIYLLIIQF